MNFEDLPQDWKTWPEEKKKALLRRLKYDWKLWARPEQRAPQGDWGTWLFLAGRGAGKTRTMAEYCKEYALAHPHARIAVICPTYGVVRDVAYEGESGLLGVIPGDELDKNGYNRSLHQIRLRNGSAFYGYSGADPERLRGPQHHLIWCEELAAWQYLQATWDMSQFGLRLGEFPRVVISTTPRPLPLIKELIAREAEDDVAITRATMFANAANLPKSMLDQLKRRYGGTHLGMQELMGLVIDDVAGALWKREMLEADRITADVMTGEVRIPQMARVVVGVDPAATSSPDADETGIVVAGRGVDGHAYVFSDRSLRASPDGWAQAANRARIDFQGDRIVAERNNGGEMVEHTVHTVDRNIPYKGVWASRGKLTRAEPVSALYEQHRVHHVGDLAKLEDEMCTWIPNDPKFPSPNRVDALVWALTELMLGGGGSAEIVVANAGMAGRIPRL